MRAWIDEERCEGAGLCAETCPDVFELQGDKAVVKIPEDEDLPEELVEPCREAAEACPCEAIFIEE